MTKLLYAFVLGMFVFATPFVTVEHTWAQEQVEDYICPMHPHIHGEEGETCPICGMDLVPAPKQEMNTDMGNMEGVISMSSSYIQKIGVRTEKAKERDLNGNIQVMGKIVPSTHLESVVAPRVNGWVQKLVVGAEGLPVKKGQVVMYLYSPDMLSAQKDFIAATRSGNKNRIQTTRKRLELLGIANTTIQQIGKKNTVLDEIPLLAPRSGVLTQLSVREGSYVKAGTTIFKVQDFSEVWVEADVLEEQLADIRNSAKVILPSSNKEFNAKVDVVYPSLNAQTRTGKVRLLLDNSNGELYTGTYVDVRLDSKSVETLSVPQQAVLRTKNMNYVIKSLGKGMFKPSMVKIRKTVNGYTAIIDGVETGDDIVVNGQFLIDAESQIRGGLSVMDHAGMDMSSDTDMTTMGGSNHE